MGVRGYGVPLTEKVEDALDRQQYETKTRGERVRPEARRAGEGVYVLARHGDHTHLAYDVLLTKKSGSPSWVRTSDPRINSPRRKVANPSR